jgi:excisionase family DNA binding protein
MDIPAPSAAREAFRDTDRFMHPGPQHSPSPPRGEAERASHRHSLSYLSVPTLNRKAFESSDLVRKVRYLRKLIIRLDGDIGDRELDLRERTLDGTPNDLPVRQLEIDRLRHLRNHADALLQFLIHDPPGAMSECGGEDRSITHGRAAYDRDITRGANNDDDQLTIQELGKHLSKSRSTVCKWVSAKKIPCVKVRRSGMPRRDDIRKWIKEQSR